MNAALEHLIDVRGKLTKLARLDPTAKGDISNQARRLIKTTIKYIRKLRGNTPEEEKLLVQAEEQVVLAYQHMVQHQFTPASIYDASGNHLEQAQLALEQF